MNKILSIVALVLCSMVLNAKGGRFDIDSHYFEDEYGDIFNKEKIVCRVVIDEESKTMCFYEVLPSNENGNLVEKYVIKSVSEESESVENVTKTVIKIHQEDMYCGDYGDIVFYLSTDEAKGTKTLLKTKSNTPIKEYWGVASDR